jgi:hypothetical protein
MQESPPAEHKMYTVHTRHQPPPHHTARGTIPVPSPQRATHYQLTTTDVQRASHLMVYVIPNLVSTDILNATFNQVFNTDIDNKCP